MGAARERGAETTGKIKAVPPELEGYPTLKQIAASITEIPGGDLGEPGVQRTH